LTIADISVGYALHLAQVRGAEALLTPLALAYLERLRARPAFQRAAAK
jgi:glutathione S-transferase